MAAMKRRGPSLAVALGAAMAVLIFTAAVQTSAAKPGKAYVAKAKRVAQNYWRDRRPGASCADWPVQVSIIPIGETAMSAGPIGICEQPYDPANPPNGLPAIQVTKSAAREGWLPFCTLVIKGWGLLSGAPSSHNPHNVMFKITDARNYQNKACGKAPG